MSLTSSKLGDSVYLGAKSNKYWLSSIIYLLELIWLIVTWYLTYRCWNDTIKVIRNLLKPILATLSNLAFLESLDDVSSREENIYLILV
jgi:positive regulator of sigma E activity